MTAGGLFFTFVFSIWQFVEDMKEKNCKTILDIEDNINERIDFIVTQFTKALEDTRTRSEKEDEIHNNKLDSNENRIVNINSELANIRELLTHHLNSFGHTRSIEQQQDIITRLAKVEAELKLSLEYKKIEDCNSQLSNAIESLKKDFTALQNSLER